MAFPSGPWRLGTCLDIKKVSQIPIPAGYRQTIVTPNASRNVEAYWSSTTDVSGESLILPDGRCDVIVRDNVLTRDAPIPIITGPATHPFTVTFKAGDRWSGIRLRPAFGAVLWQDLIAGAANSVRQGPDAIALIPALAGLDPNRASDALSNVLHNSHPADTRLTLALDAVHASGGRLRIERLAHHAGCTARQLNRLFRANVGLSTKTYAQLVQFRRSLLLIQRQGLSISDAAFEAGYADHAHLTRTCQRFAGLSPSSLPPDLTVPTLFA